MKNDDKAKKDKEKPVVKNNLDIHVFQMSFTLTVLYL